MAERIELTGELRRVGRLALRVEDTFWVAYYALPDTMEGALELARIRMQFVEHPKRKTQFMDMMRNAVGDILEDATGVRPQWPDGAIPAPEHERKR